VGLVVGVFGLARLFLNLPAGILSQRFGGRMLMTGGLFLTAAGTGLMGMADGISQMILWRFLAGAGSAMYMTGSMSFIANISTTENRGKLLSLQQGSLLLGVDIGPAVGGFVADALGYRWPFYLGGILAALSGVWILLSLPRGNGTSVRRAPQQRHPPGREQQATWDVKTIKTLLTTPTFILVSVFTLLVFFTRTGSRQTLLPLIAVGDVGMSATQLGLLFTVMTTTNLLLVLPAGVLSDRFGRKAVVLPGTLLSLLGLSMFAFGRDLWMFYGAAVVLGLGTGVIGPTPAAYAGDLAPPGKTGVSMGLYRTFGDVGFVVGPILLGLIADALQGQFANVSGLSIAMEVNAVLLTIAAIALVLAARETAGRHRSTVS